MSFAGKVWRLLVGIKDALALLFLLLFFVMLFALLSARPNPGASVRGGALLLELNGSITEEAAVPDPFDLLTSGQLPTRQFQVRDLVRALDAAASDDRIKAVVLDLRNFTGGGHVHMQDVASAIDRVRAAEKPVLTYALAYEDDGVMLAAHASEVWMDPMGGALVLGPGGTNLYYAGLIDRFDVKAKVYRVGTYKSAVEPYLRSDMSPEARENYQALYGAIWEEWKANVKKARPQADLDKVTGDTVAWLAEHKGDTAKAAIAAGLADKLGIWEEFGARVAEIVGEDEWDDSAGSFKNTDYSAWLASLDQDKSGKTIGVITIAGEIVDGTEGPGISGGTRIAKLLDDALDDDLAALVVRVNSPGGSVTASEEIRRAILRHKAKGIPIAVSMANVAASGGYWVSTPADRIFAEPETITGSIGIFGVVPTFEDTLANYGVTSDGVRTTPLSGQPDILGGFTPETDAVLQQTIEHGYDLFLGLVAESRGSSAADIDKVAQGRVWDGGTARQHGLVDQFGGINDALAWAANAAKLEDGDWHARWLASPIDPTQALIMQMLSGNSGEPQQANGLFGMIARQQAHAAAQVEADMNRLFGTAGVQAYCLECPSGEAPAQRRATSASTTILRRLLLD